MGKAGIKTKSGKLLLDVAQMVDIRRHNGIPNNRGIFKLRS
jgi:hypothetical protein